MSTGGSRWHKIDFHLHTPGVDSFAALNGINYDSPVDQQMTAEAYAAQLKSARIEIAAITDYNGIRQPWFNLIKAAAGALGITVLPGAELSLSEGKNGVHILAVFPEDTDPTEINEYLRALDRKPARQLWNRRKHEDIDLQFPLAEALVRMRERYGCLLIAAHGDSKKGIVESLGAENAGRLIVETDLDGIDHPGHSIAKLRSTRIPGRWEHLACVEFSDPRSIPDIGGKPLPDGTARGTWLKLSSQRLDAMRLAMHDPQTRVRTTQPAQPSNARIVSITIDGSGFLAHTSITFDPHLNALIGGRGTGKSALLETIRYALDLPVFCERDRRLDLVRHALGSGGMVTLEIERDGEHGPAKRYQVRRVLGEPPQVHDGDTGQPIAISARDTFGPGREPVVLLQREIDKVSGDGAYRRELLDHLIGEDVRDAEARVDEARRQLSLNSAELRKHLLEQGKRPELERRSGQLRHELELYEQSGVVDKLAVHRQMETVERRLKAAAQLTVPSSIGHWCESLATASSQVDDMRSEVAGQCDELTDSAEQVLQTLSQIISSAQERVLTAGEEAHQAIQGLLAKHTARVEPLAGELNRIKQELHAEKLDPDRTLALTGELDQIAGKLANLDRKLPAGEALRRTRQGLLDELAKAREYESRVRQDAAATINGRVSERVEVVVVPYGDRNQFAGDMRTLLHGSGATTSAIDTIAFRDGVDGPSIARILEAGHQELTDRFCLSAAQAMKIHGWLTSSDTDRISELEILAPHDRVDIRLFVDGESRSLDRLSAGQRATAILLLVFAVENKCMLLDQPEDDLDNRFIFDDVVTMIRRQKALTLDGSNRQIITATHNPNIPVLGDAELVVVLEADHTGIALVALGSIDATEIRTQIRQVLEGGEEAFLRRYQKYGGIRIELPRQGLGPRNHEALQDSGPSPTPTPGS